MASRGAKLEPGRVLMIYELQKEELRILRRLIMEREMRASNNQNHI